MFSFIEEYAIDIFQNERLQGGNEIPTSIKTLLHYMRIADFTGTISDEIGGGNGIQGVGSIRA